MMNPLLTLSRSMQWTLGMIGVAAVFLVWDQQYWWDTVADYSFGYLVPLLFIYILWQRFPLMGKPLEPSQLERPSEPPSQFSSWLQKLEPFTRGIEACAFSSAIFGLLLFSLGALLRAALGPLPEASFLLSFGFGISVLNGVFLAVDHTAAGRRVPLDQRFSLMLLFLFPAFIWIITAPMIEGVERQISVFLLDRVTVIVFTTLEAIGLALVREGNILHLPKGQVGVEEACSGIRSLTACLFTGSFLAAAFLDKFWKKIVLIVLALGLAFATNILRSFFLTLWAYHYGSQALEDTFFNLSVHDLTGYSVLVITSLGLFALLPLFDLFTDLDDEDEPTVVPS